MENAGSISLWIQQLKEGDPHAAQKLWERYCRRLVGLARKKLGDSPRRSVDEEDVVLSAFNTFCQRAQAEKFPDLHDRNSLWPLLALITARKAASERKHQRRAKRGGGRQLNQLAADDSSSGWNFVAEEPSPADAAIFLSELERFMDSLDDPTSRLILLWKLEERTNVEIARSLDCSLTAVERKLRFIRKRLSREVTE
jgi:RNA polymerase sigma factor (sigma-70 family)